MPFVHSMWMMQCMCSSPADLRASLPSGSRLISFTADSTAVATAALHRCLACHAVQETDNADMLFVNVMHAACMAKVSNATSNLHWPRAIQQKTECDSLDEDLLDEDLPDASTVIKTS